MLLTLINKNIKQLIRSKTSSLIVLLGPLLIIALLGFAFNNVNEYALNMGVYSETYSKTTEDFITSLETQNYIVTKLNSELDCINAVKDTTIHACIIFPPDMKISDNEKPNINFYVDASNEKIVYNVISTITTKLNVKTKEYSKDLITSVMASVNTVSTDVEEIVPKISDISMNLETSSQKSSDISSKLNNMQLDGTVKGTTNLSTLAKDNDLRYVAVESTLKNTLTTLESAVDDLDNMKDSLNSTLKADVIDLIENMDNEINATKATLNSSTKNYTKIYDRINNLVINLQSLESKLSSAKEARADIVNAVSIITDKLKASENSLSEINAKINNIRTNLNSLNSKNPDLLTSPFDVRINYEKPNHFQSMFGSMLIIVIMFVSILLSTNLIIKERESPAYFRNTVSPINPFIYIISIYLTNMIIVGIQIAIMLLVAIYQFKLVFQIPYMVIVLLLGTSFFSFMGMVIGYLFSSEETATIAAVSTSALLMFLSDLIIPIESIPRLILKYVKFNPVYRLKTIMNMFNNNNPKVILIALQNELFIYVAIIMGLLILTLILANYSRKNIFKFLYFRGKRKRRK